MAFEIVTHGIAPNWSHQTFEVVALHGSAEVATARATGLEHHDVIFQISAVRHLLSLWDVLMAWVVFTSWG